VAAPTGYLRDLPAPIAADCLTHGLQRLGNEGNRANALFHSNGNFICRAFTSDDYARIWNWEICHRESPSPVIAWRCVADLIGREMRAANGSPSVETVELGQERATGNR
jgi:hypothetical protein